MFESIKNALIEFANWVLALVKAVFLAVWDFVIDGVCYVVDKILTWLVSLISALDVSAFSGLNAWGGLPPEVGNIIGLIGLGQCMTIIAAAIVIRLTMQLIPFVRLGS